MANFLDDFMYSMGPDVSEQLSETLGIERNTAQQIIPQIAPLILGGLKRQKDDFGGIDRVDHILNKYGDDSVLEDLSGNFAAKAHDDSVDASLGGLLGDSGFQASNMLSKQFNLDGNIAAKIIPMLAPIVLGFLTRQRKQSSVGSTGIADLLDRDGDGSILDDVAGLFMQGMGGQSSASGGLLGKILGGLVGRKR